MGVVVRLPKRSGPRGEQTFVVGLAVLAMTAGFFIGSFLPTLFHEFAGADGTTRFVRRHRFVRRFACPGVGDTVALWYDPNDPGDAKKIVIGS